MKKIVWTTVAMLIALAASSFAEDIAVTIYNSNLGVVSETRNLEFESGSSQLAFRDVPASIDPASVRFELIGSPDDVTILEQSYAYDLVNPQQMFLKYVDQAIDLVDEDGNVYNGTLLSVSGGEITIQESSGRIKILSRDDIREVNFPVLPDGLITRPTLFWLYDSNMSGRHDCRVSYQTGGISWTAEYVGRLSADDSRLDLSGWASITNNSGKSYHDAALKLIAGDIARATPDVRGVRKMGISPMSEMKADAGFQEKSFFEYHMYSLPRKATVANREIKQISLFEPANASVEKVYLYKPDVNNKQVAVAIRFVNSDDAGLGMPLPAGRVRLFKADEDESMILLGEDRIDHTPKDEKVDLTVGYAFDIAAEEKTLDRRRVSQTVEEIVFQIELRNRKEEPVTITVEKKLNGFWEIIDASSSYEKKDASTITFDVMVPAEAETTLGFTVRYTRR